jgi:polysaccharide export outer membrane protein
VDRLPLTGDETVLDAIACIPHLPLVASKGYVLLARPSRGDGGGAQTLPVDWAGISQRGEMRTNYALHPNDRVYVVPRPSELPRYSCFVDPLERARAAAGVWWLAWELMSR